MGAIPISAFGRRWTIKQMSESTTPFIDLWTEMNVSVLVAFSVVTTRMETRIILFTIVVQTH